MSIQELISKVSKIINLCLNFRGATLGSGSSGGAPHCINMVDQLKKQIELLRERLQRRTLKTSQIAEL